MFFLPSGDNMLKEETIRASVNLVTKVKVI